MRYPPLLLLLLLLLLLCACGNLTYSLGDRVLLVPDACIASGEGLDVLEAAAGVWNARGAHFVVYRDGPTAIDYDQVLPVGCVPNDDLNMPLPDGGASRDQLVGQYLVREPLGGGNRIVIDQSYWHPPQDGTCCSNAIGFEALVVHELGHALGCSHVLDGNAIMFWAMHPLTKDGVTLDAQDLLDLECAQGGSDCVDVHFDPKH